MFYGTSVCAFSCIHFVSCEVCASFWLFVCVLILFVLDFQFQVFIITQCVSEKIVGGFQSNINGP